MKVPNSRLEGKSLMPIIMIIGISDLPSSLEFGTFIPFASINVGSKSIASTKSLEFVPLVLSALFLEKVLTKQGEQTLMILLKQLTYFQHLLRQME